MRVFSRFILPILLTFSSLLPIAGQPYIVPSPQREVRAVWFCTLGGMDWPGHQYAQTAYKAELQKRLLCQTFDQLQRAGINTILFQTRLRSTTAYPSRYEPWDGAFSGTPGVAPPYDVLAFAVEEAHRRGMELHAYLVAYPICSVALAKQLGKQSLPARRPDLCVRAGDKWMMDPGRPGTAEHIAAMAREIVENYDVDGIHLDYIRYPEKEVPFNDNKTYAHYGYGQPKAQWRRDNVTRTVRKVAEAVRSVRPWVKMSCSPIGKYADLPLHFSYGWNARDAVNQDAQAWLREGWMDMLFPMMYFDGKHFYPFAVNWHEQSSGRPVIPGLGIYFLDPREKDWDVMRVMRQINFTRQLGMSGQAYFRSRFLLNNVKGLLDFVTDAYRQPALSPAMTWLDSIAPASPKWTSQIVGETLRFSWQPVADNTPVVYNLYRLTQRGAQLVEHHLRGTRFDYTPALPSLLHDTYAVVAMDAYGNESLLPKYQPHAPSTPHLLGLPSAVARSRK